MCSCRMRQRKREREKVVDNLYEKCPILRKMFALVEKIYRFAKDTGKLSGKADRAMYFVSKA